MKEKTIAAFIGSEGEVVAMTKKACYYYNRELSEQQAKKLLAKINEAQEINP